MGRAAPGRGASVPGAGPSRGWGRRSPGTLVNLRQNASSVEVNVVDPLVRKGYRFKGIASVLESGPLYDKVKAFLTERGVKIAIREVVLIQKGTGH